MLAGNAGHLEEDSPSLFKGRKRGVVEESVHLSLREPPPFLSRPRTSAPAVLPPRSRLISGGWPLFFALRSCSQNRRERRPSPSSHRVEGSFNTALASGRRKYLRHPPDPQGLLLHLMEKEQSLRKAASKRLKIFTRWC